MIFMKILALHFGYGAAVGLVLCARRSTARKLELMRQMNPNNAQFFTKTRLFVSTTILGLFILVDSILTLFIAFAKRNESWAVAENTEIVLKDVTLREAEAVARLLKRTMAHVVDYEVDVTNKVVRVLSLTNKHEVNLLLSLLDLNDFVQLRDAAAILTMYQCGIRINTLSQLERKHVDPESKLFKIDGGIVKNHQQILLPMSDTQANVLDVLMRQNDIIRREYGVRNDFIFITRKGGRIATSPTNNNIQKRLNKYAREYGFKKYKSACFTPWVRKESTTKGSRCCDNQQGAGAFRHRRDNKISAHGQRRSSSQSAEIPC